MQKKGQVKTRANSIDKPRDAWSYQQFREKKVEGFSFTLQGKQPCPNTNLRASGTLRQSVSEV